MNVHIMGAACAGLTTLGNALAEKLAIPYFDTDHFFGKSLRFLTWLEGIP
jgi:shikimate kinase